MKFVNEIVGAEELKEVLSQVAPKEAANVLRRTTADVARDLRDEIRAAAPVDTGTLKKAIVSKRDRGTPGSVEASVTITKGKSQKNDAWYWHMIEFGTVFRAARPFIVPATERFRGRLKEIFEANFWLEFENQLTRRRGFTIK